MPTTLSWEGLLLLIRRKLHTLLRYGAIEELAVAYERLSMHFEVDDREHDIPVCHCWCSINTFGLDASVIHHKLQSMGLILIDDECEISDDYLEGMRNLILRWEDCIENTKYIRWIVNNRQGCLHLIRTEFGCDK